MQIQSKSAEKNALEISTFFLPRLQTVTFGVKVNISIERGDPGARTHDMGHMDAMLSGLQRSAEV